MKAYQWSLFAAIAFFSLTISASGQIVQGRGNKKAGKDTLVVTNAVTAEGDTIRVKMLDEFEVLTVRTFKKKAHQQKYDRLVRNVKKVYPYARMVGDRMVAYNTVLQSLNRKERKRLVKVFEDEVKKEHGDALKKLTIGQGRILLRLIDRQTSSSSYEIVEDLRGSVEAFFWDAVAGVFDFDLKKKFDPVNELEDKYIDEICKLIDAGAL